MNKIIKKPDLSVCIIQPVMKSYRVPFFLGLRDKLQREGIKLTVVYSKPWTGIAKSGDNVLLPSEIGCQVKSIYIFGKFLMQFVFRAWWRADLIVIEHANKHLLNYFLLILQRLGIKHIAFWGHGLDRQVSTNGYGERFKRWTLRHAHWWFAYTQGAAKYVASQGFSPERITIVENAVDTTTLSNLLASVTDSERSEALASFGWDKNDRVGIYCGSLYENKRIDILFESADLVAAIHPDFRLLIMGGGVLEAEVRHFVSSRKWSRYVGPSFGRDKAVLLSLGELWLNPGLVGLGILDAFCAGLPLITTNTPVHSPEIEYLEVGYNGLMVEVNSEAFAMGIDSLLCNQSQMNMLRQGASESGSRYTIETMVNNFSEGIQRCLKLS